MNACRICKNESGNADFLFEEKMFAFRDRFEYFQCGLCGCLQIADPPADLTRFYPPHYYSYGLTYPPSKGIRSFLGALRDRMRLTSPALIPKRVRTRFKCRADLASLGEIPIHREMRILDVGCGNGQLLVFLHRAGFRHLIGIDPYLSSDLEPRPGLKVRRQQLSELTDPFDVIMFHHVLEHAPEQLETLELARDLLKAGGKILLRVPVCDSKAWEEYGGNWVQLDAPRHFFLHTRRSLKIIAERAGLVLERSWCDSTFFQFWGSELYRRSIPLINAGGVPAKPEDYFSHQQIQDFEVETQKLNNMGCGDQVVAILSRSKERTGCQHPAG